MLRAFCILVGVLVATSSSRAASIIVEPADNPKDRPLIVISGTLLPDDWKEFQNKTTGISNAIVVLRSDGGSVVAGISIGERIRSRNYWTIVPDGYLCASACALAWLGGTTRYMGPTSRVGFHAVYTIREGQMNEAGMGNALVGAYVSNLALSYSAVIYITKASPNSMTWLTPEDAEQVGIEVSVLKPRPQATSSPPTSPVTTPAPAPASNVSAQLRQRANEFVDALYGAISGPNNVAVASASRNYADQVAYFGKTLAREEVVAEVQRFIDRWPSRQYRARPDSIDVQCDEPSLTCTAKGVLDFDAKSLARNERSVGTASFEYSLKFDSSSSGTKITYENGAVSERRVEPLTSHGSASNTPWKRPDYE